MTLLWAADEVGRAARLKFAHHRQFAVVNALSAAAIGLQRTYPDFRTEGDSVAAKLLEWSAEGAPQEQIHAVIDHLIDQLEQASGNDDLRLLVMHWAMQPERTLAVIGD